MLRRRVDPPAYQRAASPGCSPFRSGSGGREAGGSRGRCTLERAGTGDGHRRQPWLRSGDAIACAMAETSARRGCHARASGRRSRDPGYRRSADSEDLRATAARHPCSRSDPGACRPGGNALPGGPGAEVLRIDPPNVGRTGRGSGSNAGKALWEARLAQPGGSNDILDLLGKPMCWSTDTAPMRWINWVWMLGAPPDATGLGRYHP